MKHLIQQSIKLLLAAVALQALSSCLPLAAGAAGGYIYAKESENN